MAEVTLEHIQTKQDVSTTPIAALVLAIVEHVKAANQRLDRIEERITKLEEVR